MKKYMKFKGAYVYATPEQFEELKQRYNEESGNYESQDALELVEEICDELAIGLIFNKKLEPKLK